MAIKILFEFRRRQLHIKVYNSYKVSNQTMLTQSWPLIREFISLTLFNLDDILVEENDTFGLMTWKNIWGKKNLEAGEWLQMLSFEK